MAYKSVTFTTMTSLIERCGRFLLQSSSAGKEGVLGQMSVRYKPGKGRKWGVSPTKNHFQKTNAKNRGLRVYDGQRVMEDKTVVAQFWPRVFPGWNVSTDITTIHSKQLCTLLTPSNFQSVT